MSGFAVVKSSVSFCIRIMSPLFTVAMVGHVWALEGVAAKRGRSRPQEGAEDVFHGAWFLRWTLDRANAVLGRMIRHIAAPVKIFLGHPP